MTFNFDFQLFADELSIPGIDEDILKELDVTPSAEVTEDKPEEVETVTEKTEPQPTADADSVKKRVEDEGKDEYEEYKEGQAIPYDRFKSVNDRRKTAENRIRELEEKLKSYESAPKEVKQEVVPQEQKPVQAEPMTFDAAQRKRVCELAMQRAKTAMQLTDEDVEAMEYADDGTEKIMYQREIAKQIEIITNEIQEFAQKEKFEQNMFSRNVNRFNDLSQKVAAFPDAPERMKFILDDNFVTLDREYQHILNDAYKRLQTRQGTDADFHLVNSYFKRANKRWEDAHKPQAAPAANTKITEVQKLPKAPNINGGGGGDKVYTIAELTELLNSPDGWDRLPEKIKQDILKGKIPM